MRFADSVEDLAVVEPLWNALQEHHSRLAPRLGGNAPARGLADSWRRRRAKYERWLEDPETFFLIAEDEGRPIGYAFVTVGAGFVAWDTGERTAELETLSVLPDHRGDGVGEELLNAVWDRLRERGVRDLIITTAASNVDARRFYERHGFTEGFVMYYRKAAVTVDELIVADSPATWAEAGFAVEGDTCVVGDVRIRLAGPEAGRGLVGWSLREVDSTDLDGLATTRSERPLPTAAPPHPNGVSALDHVVAITPALERTVDVLSGAGLDLRRIREEPTPAGAPRQAFFRLGPTILEVIQQPDSEVERRGGPDRPAFFWGLAFLAPDLDAAVAALGERVSEIRPAVQPGRRIATLRRAAGLGLPAALITPRPDRLP